VEGSIESFTRVAASIPRGHFASLRRGIPFSRTRRGGLPTPPQGAPQTLHQPQSLTLTGIQQRDVNLLGIHGIKFRPAPLLVNASR
jgi:hypothetical protein